MKAKKKSSVAKDVDEYLGEVSDEARRGLEKLRKQIKAAAPNATEVISYRMPIYKHSGMLVGFAAFKNHCSFFVMSRKVMNDHREVLKGYSTETATIHFPFNKPLPAALVKKLVKARIAENEAKRKR